MRIVLGLFSGLFGDPAPPFPPVENIAFTLLASFPPCGDMNPAAERFFPRLPFEVRPSYNPTPFLSEGKRLSFHLDAE